MKKIYRLAILALIAIVGVSCSNPTAPPPPEQKYPPTILVFTATPQTIHAGEIVYIVVSIRNLISTELAQVRIDRDYKDQWGSTLVASFPAESEWTYNTVRDYPTKTTIYTLTVSNSDGEAKDTRTITVI